jgi:large subunit ribosomal protein L35
MQKMKSHRGAAKRFSFSKKGKIKRARAYASHLKESKSPKQKRRLRQQTLVSKADAKKIRKLLPG